LTPSVSPHARDAVGTVTYRHVSEPLSLRQLKEYVAGTGDELEPWEDAASAARRPVPPLFFHAACRPIVAERDLQPDGQYKFLGIDGVDGSTMSGGQKFEALAPVYLGDVLSVEERLLSISEKVGRSGPLVITETQADYTNQRGELVARYRQTIIFR
jgi:hydroxyacyl-ACP dehydratase HTD2-like protein with hotdog domain